MSWRIGTRIRFNSTYYQLDDQGWFRTYADGTIFGPKKCYLNGLTRVMASKLRSPKFFNSVVEVDRLPIPTECQHEIEVPEDWPDTPWLDGATVDCPACNSLLILKANKDRTLVQALLFHTYMNFVDPMWPKDGKGTDYVDF